MNEQTVELFDRSGRPDNAYRPLKPVLIKRAEIEREIERLSSGEFPGSRRTTVAHPGLRGNLGLYPACRMSINVLLPGEATKPHRHNSSVVNFCMRGAGTSLINGTSIEFGEHDVWTTPPWAVHQHRNDTDAVQVRFSYSNAGLLDLMQVHVVDERDHLDPSVAPSELVTEHEVSARGEVIGEDGAALLSYEELISPDPPALRPLHWEWAEIRSRLEKLRSLGSDYQGRRLFLLYDRSTGRTQGTTSTFFAAITIRPGGIVDEPHRHTSAAINYFFGGKGWSRVGGERYEWESGDLMLSAPGWMIHGHASHDGDDVFEITIQDSPLQIALGSLLWHEHLGGDLQALGVEQGFSTNRELVSSED